MFNLAEGVDGAVRPLRDRHYVVLPRKGIAYGRVPKAANSSVKQALHRLEWPRRETPRRINRDAYWAARSVQRAYLATSAEVAAQGDALFVFAVVRNPFDRLLSCYRDKLVGRTQLHPAFAYTGFDLGMSFRDFVLHACTVGDLFSNNHLRSQYDMLSYQGRLLPEHVCRVERLPSDWRALRRKLRRRRGVRLPNVAHRHAQSRGPALSDVYDRTMVRAVRRRYALDFETFYPNRHDPKCG